MIANDDMGNAKYPRTVDVYIATLPRQLHVVETLKSVLENPETLSVTITANKYSDSEFQQLTEMILNVNSIFQIPIYLHRGDNKKESNEKLKYIGRGKGEYISFVDDDLLLPSDYFKKMIKGCEKYQAYVSLHGVILHPRPLRSYYRDRNVYRGLGTVAVDQQVDIASNCGSLFKRKWFPQVMLDEIYESVNEISMDDIWMAYYCKRQGIKRYVLAHPEGYLKHKVQYEEDMYVFNKYALTGNDGVQTDFINKYWDAGA